MRQPYPSDLSDSQWELFADFFPEAETGRPREVDLRAVVDAIFYVNRTGVQWRYLPHDFPRWDVVYSYFRKWGKDGTWDTIQRQLRETTRQAAGREATPSLACVDSQSVKGTECGGDHGIDGHKKINGVKRHILVDTMGLLLAVFVSAASLSDAKAARHVFQRATTEGFLRKEFKVIKWRWVVERTFAWLGRYRRNSRDYEKLPQTSENMLKVSGIQLMLRRLKPQERSFVFYYPRSPSKQAI